jgi:hypothetical protein
MSERDDILRCPVCGRINVLEPAGHEALCGRRVTWADAPGILYPAQEQWRERMLLVAKCRRGAMERRR